MKNILVFEADSALADDLKGQFGQYGCSVEIVDDGNVGLQKARSTRPDLILLTIELPKMNGFSICNKLKKNPELKSIPLIILSSEATEDTFAQHRKLRTHAEDYLRKPFEFNQLLGKVSSLIQLDAEVSSVPSQLPISDDDEISVDTSGLDLLVEEDADVGSPLGDDDVEAFADSAFAALQMDDDFDDDEVQQSSEPFDQDDQTVAIDHPRAYLEPSIGGENIDNTPDVSASEAIAFEDSSEETQFPSVIPDSFPPPGPVTSESVEVPTPSHLMDLSEGAPVTHSTTPAPVAIDEEDVEATVDLSKAQAQLQEAKSALEKERESVREREVELTEELSKAQAQLQEAKSALEKERESVGEREVELNEELGKLRSETEELRKAEEEWKDEEKKLHRDKDELNNKVSLLNDQLKTVEKDGGKGGGAVSSREFLDLRELLNKKDREILDFKDQLNAKEKALLEQRERITALEREIADISDKSLSIEREREELKDRSKALEDDKELLTKKVAGLEKRFDASSKDNERLKKELEDQKNQNKVDSEAAEERRLKELEEQKTQLTTEGESAKDAALAALREELTSAHQAELEQVKQEAEERREADLTASRIKHEETLKNREEELETSHEQAITELGEKHNQELQEVALRHREEQTKLEEQKNQEVETLKQEHASTTETLNQEHASATETLKQEHASATETLNQEHASATETLKQEHASASDALNQEHAKALGELLQTHREELKVRDAKQGELESNLEQSQSDLEKQNNRVSELEVEISQQNSVVNTLEGEKSQLGEELSKTSTQLRETVGANAHNQQRAEAALGKIQADNEVVEKSKRAMAIALTLLSDLTPHEDAGPPKL